MYRKFLSIIFIVILMTACIPNTLFAAEQSESKVMVVGQSFEVGIDHMWYSQNPDIVEIEYRPCPAFQGCTHDYAIAVAPGTAILKSSNGYEIMEIKVIPKDTDVFKICGYIVPDFTYPDEVANEIRENFRVEVVGTGKSTLTNSKGYFEISDISKKSANYVVRIDNVGYLDREIIISSAFGDCQMSSIDSPIKMWAGDFAVNSAPDNVINMNDVIGLINSEYFNTYSEIHRYRPICDLNLDNVLNMGDVIILAKYFGKTSEDYPKPELKYSSNSAETPLPEHTPTVVPSPTPVVKEP
ncbi:hypothetical protein [Pseudobacteroides cellulosolvens]|uniref:Dockerin domain-containing protein n=1 Tax=Pseudobacteroides cellulosolvens ATCC 35603 = DSM 2933 TaxID=398512 RepID=A0A0L6JV29_9FIRM|nr:hypothetical protein [Pseudobacteroides cellulosolvens]KNY29688.1 hypothetical protein Bccel_4962 [Pseudobacteroides cellulosolvens ATCC 35603 = DSM 2933]